jgi:phosphoribosylformimino-5-aminoimidazole carboxamide ribotide isomerase
MDLLPAIDLQRGRVSRLLRGNFEDPVFYSLDPVGTAISFFETGFSYLHIVDLDGAKSGKPAHTAILRDICSTGMTVHYGGGLREISDIEQVLEIGAARAMVGSLLFSARGNPEELFSIFGNRILPTVDIRDDRAALRGWTSLSDISACQAVRILVDSGFTEALVTSVERDGTLSGPDINLYRTISDFCPGFRIIAAGGISSCSDLMDLQKLGCSGAVLGKSIYEGLINPAEALRAVGSC